MIMMILTQEMDDETKITSSPLRVIISLVVALKLEGLNLVSSFDETRSHPSEVDETSFHSSLEAEG